MSDIVERLRALGTEWAKATGECGPGVASLQREAADEIERLRAAAKTLATIFEDDPAMPGAMQFVSWAPTTYGELRNAVAAISTSKLGQ